jgi:hypothetical protein
MAFVEIESADDHKAKYPVLKMHHDGDLLVLFHKPDYGPVLWSLGHWNIGDGGASAWNEEDFAVWHGTLTITE